MYPLSSATNAGRDLIKAGTFAVVQGIGHDPNRSRLHVDQLMLDSIGVGCSVLGLVEGESLLPCLACEVEVVGGDVGMAEAVEGVGFFVNVAEVAEDGEGLPVVIDGLGVLPGVVGDVAEAVQRESFAVAVVVAAKQGERSLAVMQAWSWLPRRVRYQPTWLSPWASSRWEIIVC